MFRSGFSTEQSTLEFVILFFIERTVASPKELASDNRKEEIYLPDKKVCTTKICFK
jgi:hypothetical protein